MTPGWGQFWPQGYNLKKLGRGLLGCYIPNIKALGILVPDKKIFSCFLSIAFVNYVTPGAGHFWPQGHNFNKCGRGS